MKILLLGSGGREHAFAWKIAQSNICDQLFIAPGNGGTQHLGYNLSIDVLDFEAIAQCIKENFIDMVVVGPEQPLVKGISDYLQKIFPALKIIGPSQKGAMLEGSKLFAKKFMNSNNIPTAGYKEADHSNLSESIDWLNNQKMPIVLKADGLAGGKGVVICQTKEEAIETLNEMIEHQKFGSASSTVVIEEFLNGLEFSIFVLTDGLTYKILPTAKDYKRIGEGDTGLNTGGMGAVSPAPFVNLELMKKVEQKVIKPTIEGLQREHIDYKGFIYFGLIKVNDEPYVIEYNSRLGDPEAQAVIPRIKSDLVDLFDNLCLGTLNQAELEITNDICCTVVLTSKGYPEKYKTGEAISGLKEFENGIVFHAGTLLNEKNLQTNGGRVLAISSSAKDLTSSLKNCYEIADQINFTGKYLRKDIGFEFL